VFTLFPLFGLVMFAAVAAAQTTKSQLASLDSTEQPSIVLSPELTQALTRIREAALNDDYAYRQVAHLTENIGPRTSGSPQAQAGVEYVAAELRKLGLEVRLEEVRLPRWLRGVETAELVDYPGQMSSIPQKIVVTALGGTAATPPDGLTAEVVVVDDFDQLAALGRKNIAGKIVLFNELFDKKKAAAGSALEAYGQAVGYRAEGPKRAAELGATAALVRSVGGADYRLPHTGWSAPAGIPAGAVTSEDADLIAHLAAQGKARMHLILTSENGPEVLSYNVVADLKGSEHPEQIVIVSGHLDSWDLGTGAIDDAAGVAVAMETAELVQRLRLHPKRTIRVIAWMDEENGGRGHDAYGKEHSNEFANYAAVMESDLGAGHPLGFNAKVSTAALGWLKPVQNILERFGANIIKGTTYSPGSDITPMANAGVPALGIMQDVRTYFNYHHTAADTLDKIVPQELRENAAAMAVMAYAIASLPELLPR
jgi:carboxypeptidase Q